MIGVGRITWLVILLLFPALGCRNQVGPTEISIVTADETKPVIGKSTDEGFTGFFSKLRK
jgi:hypothetical protein